MARRRRVDAGRRPRSGRVELAGVLGWLGGAAISISGWRLDSAGRRLADRTVGGARRRLARGRLGHPEARLGNLRDRASVQDFWTAAVSRFAVVRHFQAGHPQYSWARYRRHGILLGQKLWTVEGIGRPLAAWPGNRHHSSRALVSRLVVADASVPALRSLHSPREQPWRLSSVSDGRVRVHRGV